MENRWVLGNIGLDIQKILSKTKPWPLKSQKSDLRRERYAIFNFYDENYFLKNSLLLNSFHGLFRDVKLDLAIPTYQKYVNMPSHDSRDIKNIENELITKKIQVFEIRRYIYIFPSAFTMFPLNCPCETPLSRLYFFMIGRV